MAASAIETRFNALRVQVELQAARGLTLDEIEERIIAPSGLSLDEQAALWLVGWIRLTRSRRRYELNQSLVVLAAARAPAPVPGD